MTEDTSTAIVVVEGATPQSSTALVPVSDVRTAGFDLNEIKKLATQTKAIGVILPPPDIRAIVDKTASFVAKHGPEFEKRILANEKNNVKFNFLVPSDPYHAYYQMRIKNFSEGKDGEAPKDQQAVAAAAAELGKTTAAAVEVIPHALQKLEKPDDEMYTVHIPEGLTAQELDIMKLTAQFVARNGKNFLTGLSSREHTNPQFSFLRPTHSLFGFFTSLCDAYSRVLMPPKGSKDRMAKDAADRAQILERALKRLEWERVREREMKDAADEAERERLAYQAIDWHEFVVVDTIEFYDDEDDELPPPLTLKDLIKMNKARELGELEEVEVAPQAAEPAAAPAVQMSEEERQLVEQAAAVTLNVTSAPETEAAAPAADGAPPVPEPVFVPAGEMEEADMDVDMDEDEDEGPIKVVKNYVRPTGPAMAMAGGKAYDPTKFVVSPITGELVAIADMAEHMRISLIDPRWKEQREAMLSKIRDHTRANDDEIGRNLLGLAKTRPDIFGSTEEEVTQVVTESIREKLISGTQRAVAWDGVTQKGPELAAQVAAIQQNREAMGRTGQLSEPQRQQLGPAGPRPGMGGPGMGGFMPPPPPMGMGGMGGMRGPMPGGAPPLPPGGPGGPPPPPPAPMGAVAAAKAQMQAQAAGGAPPPPPPPMGMGMGGMPPPPRPPMPGMMGMGPPGMMGGPGMMPPPPPPGMRAPMPLPPREAPPPPPGEQPDSKRARLHEFVLQPEEEFLQQFPGSSKVRVLCPEVEGHDKLIGQMLEVEVASLRDTVGELKERLSSVLGLAANKMKLSRDGVGFLRDEPSLAHYNVAPDVVLQLGTKERARGKK